MHHSKDKVRTPDKVMTPDKKRQDYRGMYDPLKAHPLDLEWYGPWPTPMVVDWHSRSLQLPPDLPWTLPKTYPSPQCQELDKVYGYFKGVEEWLRIIGNIYDGNRRFFFSQVPYIIHASKILVELAQRIVRINSAFFLDRELDKRMWKSGVQEVIRTIRKSPRVPNDREKYFKSAILPMYLDQMIKIYTSFAEGVFTQVFGRRDKIGSQDNLNEKETKVVDVIYRLRICIGDMHRYAAPSASGTHFSLSFKNYEIAKSLRGDYGRAYYQQGVLAIMASDRISAMHYFAGAHSVISPTEGARGQILEIHSKSFNERLAHQQTYWYALSKYLESDVKRDRGYPRETWILAVPFPEKTETPRRPAEIPPPTKSQHISSLLTSDLFNRFSITFTETIGKLFSRVGMDEFEEVAEESLVYFEGILGREYKEGQGMNFNVMMGIVGLSISVIQSIISDKHSPSRTDEAARNQLKHYLKLATLYNLELFSIAVERLSKLVLLMDWDKSEIQYLSAAVMVWSVWLSNNVKIWTIPHVRPRFSIRRLEKSRNANRVDQTDDVWAVFGDLMTNLENLIFRGHDYAFPDVTGQEQSSHFKLPMMEECYVLQGLLPSVVGSRWYTQPFYTKGEDVQAQCRLRAVLMVRLQYIYYFGTEILTTKLEYLKRAEEHPGVHKYTCNTKLVIPKDPKDVCGLHERNYWFWVINLERINEKPVKIRRSSDYQAQTIILKKKKSAVLKSSAVTRKELPVTDINKLWSTMNDHGYRSDMVIIARRIVLDTNCFINKLPYVEKLLRIFTYPILLPVTVVLELKGLSKGGMKRREKAHFTNLNSPEAREQIKLGNEVSYNAMDALELIEKYIRYVKFVTTRGRIFGVNSVYGKIVDENFDPSTRNDNRILETCVYLEANDKETRKLDSPLRLYRKTVLLTDDRGLRVKCTVHEIPTKELESFVVWVDNYKKPSSPTKVKGPSSGSSSRSSTPRNPITPIKRK